MSKSERIQACYQHVCLLYENSVAVNNTSIRERFGLDAHKAATVSHIISDTIEAELIKVENPESGSRKFASYVPYYAWFLFSQKMQVARKWLILSEFLFSRKMQAAQQYLRL